MKHFRSSGRKASFLLVGFAAGTIALAGCRGTSRDTASTAGDPDRISRALLAESLPSLLSRWADSSSPPDAAGGGAVVLTPLGTKVGCDLPQYFLATQKAADAFWIMKSSGYAGQISWIGPLALRSDGSVDLKRHQ